MSTVEAHGKGLQVYGMYFEGVICLHSADTSREVPDSCLVDEELDRDVDTSRGRDSLFRDGTLGKKGKRLVQRVEYFTWAADKG